MVDLHQSTRRVNYMVHVPFAHDATLTIESHPVPVHAESPPPPLPNPPLSLSLRRGRPGGMICTKCTTLLQHLVLHQPPEVAVRFVGELVVAPHFDHLVKKKT